MTDELQTDVLDIDVALEKKAASNNLSVINVKSILHVSWLIVDTSCMCEICCSYKYSVYMCTPHTHTHVTHTYDFLNVV